MPPRPHTKPNKNIALYPNSHDLASLSREALILKVARHSYCAECDDCHGLAPEDSVKVVLDSDWNAEVSGPVGYITTCRCGHDAGNHAAFQDTTSEEIARRGRVAIRLDELLEDKGKVVDFDYVDVDIASLRKQMRIPEEALSPLSEDVLSLGKLEKLLPIFS
ncbi:hypothetical protein JB92DRAFT_2757391 [Gautieria morchelliformis]|nr:hypothetical protein JB92DRAFT_2757391 [Gautieria morchelliformis]